MFAEYYHDAKYIDINNNNGKRKMGCDHSRYNSVKEMEQGKELDSSSAIATSITLNPIRYKIYI